MNSTATIKLFLPYGDAKLLRIGEISNWSGKALAAPRTDIEKLLSRDEMKSAGVYFLFGIHPETGDPLAYIGEAESIGERLKQHKSKDFWVSVVTFVSKDENLTKAHVRYLEAQLIEEAKKVGRYKLDNVSQNSPKLPESDQEDMKVFMSRIRQMLPVLGSDILTPITGSQQVSFQTSDLLICKSKNALAKGRRTETGFVVFAGSTAVIEERPSTSTQAPSISKQRKKLIDDSILKEQNGVLIFAKDTEFSSPSAAAAVVHGGSTNGLKEWKDSSGKMLKDIEN